MLAEHTLFRSTLPGQRAARTVSDGACWKGVLPSPLPSPLLGKLSALELSLRKPGGAAPPPRMVWVINCVTPEKSSLDHGVLHSSLQHVGDLINLLLDIAVERCTSRCPSIPFSVIMYLNCKFS